MPEGDRNVGEVYGGAFSESAAFVRNLVKEGKMTPEEALALTEKVYKQTMLEQLLGVPQPDRPEELPEDSDRFTK